MKRFLTSSNTNGRKIVRLNSKDLELDLNVYKKYLFSLNWNWSNPSGAVQQIFETIFQKWMLVLSLDVCPSGAINLKNSLAS